MKYGSFKYGRAKYGSDWFYKRTETDLINNTDKVYINYYDLNRIENGMKTIAAKLGVAITTKTNWEYQSSASSMANFPIKEQMERIINNLNMLISSSGYIPTVEVPTSFENMDIYKMNNLERILEEMELNT